jgi:hypothetical protein
MIRFFVGGYGTHGESSNLQYWNQFLVFVICIKMQSLCSPHIAFALSFFLPAASQSALSPLFSPANPLP